MLLLYPKAFRRRYASEMRRDFGDLSREGLEEGGGRELARVWAATLSDLVVTALKERSTMLARNAYLPVAPRTAARWGALSALLGGFLGIAYSVAFTLAINTGTPDGAAWWDLRFIGEVPFVAKFLSILGMFGLYGALVARSGRPGKLALAGAAFAALSAASVLALRARHSVIMLGWVRPGDEGFSWLMNMGLVLDVLGMGGCVVGLSLLGVSAFRMRLFGPLSVLPFVVATLWPASIALLILMNTSGMDWMHYVSWLSGTLPFLGSTLFGWVLLRRTTSTDQLAAAGGASSGVAEETRGTARRAAGAVRRTTGEGWMERQRASATEATKEKELLEAIRRKGQVTVVGVALETSLSVEEADRMLSELAAKGHLEVRVEHGRLLYSLWEGDAPL